MSHEDEDLPALASLDDDAPDQSPLRHLDLDAALARRTPRPLRAAIFAGTALLIALALIPLWQYLAPARQSATSTTPQGTPVEIASNITTGAVSLNGHTVGTHLPLLLYLPHGQSVITLDAPPFHKQTCRITAPIQATTDTCDGLGNVPPLSGEQRLYRAAPQQIVSAYVVAFTLGLPNLPADQQPLALTALSDALDQQLATMSTTVPAGDHYASALTQDGAPVVTRATHALAATPVAQLSRLAGVYSCEVTVCPYIAETTLSDRPTNTGDLQWTVWLGATLGWRFTDTTSGQSTSVLFRAGLVGPTIAMTLAYSPRDGWYAPLTPAFMSQLRGEIALGLCVDGANIFSTQDTGAQPTTLLVGEQGGASLEGCALTVRLLPDDPQRVNPAVIWRFGALLASDAATATLLPALPLATPTEVASITS